MSKEEIWTITFKDGTDSHTVELPKLIYERIYRVVLDMEKTKKRLGLIE